MSFVIDLGAGEAAALFIGAVRRELVRAVSTAEKAGIKRSDIARRIGCHRSKITRLLRGSSDLTLRSIAEVAEAIGKKPRIELVDIVPAGLSANQELYKVETNLKQPCAVSAVSAAVSAAAPIGSPTLLDIDPLFGRSASAAASVSHSRLITEDSLARVA